MFCDFCDRGEYSLAWHAFHLTIIIGWHMDCVHPQIQEPPNGKWHCQECPPLPLENEYAHLQSDVFLPQQPPATPTGRESSVASSSRSIAPAKSPTKPRGKGKGKAKITTDSDSEEIDIEETPVTARGRGRPKPVKKTKPRASKAAQYSDDNEPSLVSSKRIKMQQSPPIQPLPRVRLRLPTQKGKGKEREEDEVPKGLFDEILSAEDRDTAKTSITYSDQQRFERSRMVAEVCPKASSPRASFTYIN